MKTNFIDINIDIYIEELYWEILEKWIEGSDIYELDKLIKVELSKYDYHTWYKLLEYHYNLNNVWYWLLIEKYSINWDNRLYNNLIYKLLYINF